MNNDLISRSALLKNKTRMTEYDESGCGVHVFVVKEEDVLDALAVDAEVVRHGRWVLNKHYGDYECSECGKGDFTALDFKNHNMNYCPNCGAKMRGDVNAAEKVDAEAEG